MAEKHKRVTITTATWQFYLQKLWDFIENTQSGILQFVQEGGNYAVKTGGGYWNGSDDLSSSGFGSNDDYIVIEPVTAYPGGGKWQVMIKSTNVSSTSQTACTIEVSWLGGFDTSANDFAAGYQTSGTMDYVPSYEAMVIGDSWYFSCSNSDTYTNNSGTQTYTYWRVAHWDASQSENNKFSGCYVGGYIPAEPNADTKPVCAYTRKMQTGDNAQYWGERNATASTNNGRAPGNYAHDEAGGNISLTLPDWYADYTHFYPLTRSSNWVNAPLYILDLNNNTTLGTFGKYSQLWGDYDRVDGSKDSNSLYIVTADMMFRFNEAA